MRHLKKYKIEYIFSLLLATFFIANFFYIKKRNAEFMVRVEKVKQEHVQNMSDINETTKIIDSINEDLDYINEDLEEITDLLKEMNQELEEDLKILEE